MPGTEGGGITSTKASRSACIWPRRSFRMLSVASPAFTRSSNGFRVTNTTPELGALVKVAPSKPANATACATPGRDSQDVRRLAHDAVGALQARARRQRNRGDEIGAIERRDEAGRRAGELQIGEPDQPAIEHQHDRRHAQHAPRQPARSPSDSFSNIRLKPAKKTSNGRLTVAPEARPRAHGRAAAAAAPPSAGDSVSDTIAEMIVEAAMVSANCR